MLNIRLDSSLWQTATIQNKTNIQLSDVINTAPSPGLEKEDLDLGPGSDPIHGHPGMLLVLQHCSSEWWNGVDRSGF